MNLLVKCESKQITLNVKLNTEICPKSCAFFKSHENLYKYAKCIRIVEKGYLHFDIPQELSKDLYNIPGNYYVYFR